MERLRRVDHYSIPAQHLFSHFSYGLNSDYFFNALGYIPRRFKVSDNHQGVLRVDTPYRDHRMRIELFTHLPHENKERTEKYGFHISGTSRVGNRYFVFCYGSHTTEDEKVLVPETIWIHGKWADGLPQGMTDERTNFHSDVVPAGFRNLLYAGITDGELKIYPGDLPYSIVPIPDTGLYEFRGTVDRVYCKEAFRFPFPPVIEFKY